MSKLSILWINDNPDTAHTMVFMYAINSLQRNWWNEVDIIVWGATARLVVENSGIQEKIKLAQFAGVNMVACISCATQFGVIEPLKKLDIELRAMGEPLTELIKNDEKLIII